MQNFNNQDHQNDDEEMTMDEILASIRRYVSPEPVKAETSIARPSRHNMSDSSTASVTNSAFVSDSYTPSSMRVASLSEMMPSVSPPSSFYHKESVQPIEDATASYVSSASLRSNTSALPKRDEDEVVRLGDGSISSYRPTHNAAPISSSPSSFSKMSHEEVASSGVQIKNSTQQTVEAPATSTGNLNLSGLSNQNSSFDMPFVSSAQPTADPLDHLLSHNTVAATSSLFEKLNTVVSEQKNTSQAQNSPGLTIDQLFAALAKPMIKEWLESHLPTLVESIVTKEIERITKGGRS